MTTTQDVRLRGETISDLLAAIRGLVIGEQDDTGMVAVSGDVGDPAIRALMRIEAELLLEDADALDGLPPGRTDGQRRADALCQLVGELASALRLP